MNNPNTISSIVKQAMIDLGVDSLHEYPRYLSWGMQAFRELDMENNFSKKSCVLELSPLRTVKLPADYLEFVLVGIKVGERIMPVGMDPTLTSHKSVDDCGNEIANVSTQPDIPPTGINTNAYEFYNRPLTLNIQGGKSITAETFSPPSQGYFIEDKTKNELQFSSQFPSSEVYIEYLASLTSVSGETLIDQRYYNAVVEYIHYKRCIFSERKQGVAQFHQQQFFIQKRKADMAYHNMDMQSLVNAIRQNTRLTVKY